jgi:Telomere resolvase
MYIDNYIYNTAVHVSSTKHNIAAGASRHVSRLTDRPDIMHCLYLETMSSTSDTLAAYILDTHDAKGVVEFVRERWPKSISSYISQTKKQWMTLNVINENYTTQYDTALETVDTAISQGKTREKEVLRSARAKLVAFHDMNLTEKNTVQYSGHALVDDLISSFTIFPAYIDDLRVSLTERTALQKQATAALEAKSVQSFTVQASELISRSKATLKDARANPFDIAAALGLVTGRRTIEIFKSAAFTAVTEHTVMFSGQAKKSDVAEAVTYEIPVLAAPELINTALTRLRAAKDCSALTNREVNLKYASSANAAARRLLGKEHHFHSLRGIYAVIAYNLPHRYSLNAFVAKVLGHSSLGSSLHYCCIHVEKLKRKHLFTWSAIA